MDDRKLLNLFEESELLFEMATVYRNIEDNICITVNPDPNRIGEPYFKLYNHKSYNQASKAIRISFLEPKYIIHNNNRDMRDWFLNNKEKKSLMKYLNLVSDMFNEDLNRKLSVWEKAIYLYNYENGFDKEDDNYLKLDTPIPNYLELK